MFPRTTYKSCISLLCFMATLLVSERTAKAEMLDYTNAEALFGEPVTTSATGIPQRVSEVPANMTIITADEIRQSGSRNLAEILQSVPGLDIIQESAQHYAIGIRGYNLGPLPHFLLTFNGYELSDFPIVPWNETSVNVDDIQQIEVVKGPTAALFGPNAYGGVVNIVTKSPLYDKSNVVNVTTGTQGFYSASGTQTFNGQWGGTKTSVGGFQSHEFNVQRLPGDTSSSHPDEYYLSNQTVIRVTPDFNLNGSFIYSSSIDNAINSFAGDYMSIFKVNVASLQGGFDWQSPIGLITNKNYYGHVSVGLDESTDAGTPYHGNFNDFFSQLQDQFRFAHDHSVRLGLEYQFKQLDDSSVPSMPFQPQLSENDYAIDGVWVWQMTPKLSWTNAGRLDIDELSETGTLWPSAFTPLEAYSRTNTGWSANSDIVFKATSKDSFRLGYGRGAALPGPVENGWSFLHSAGIPGVFIDAEGNPTLKPMVVQSYELDYTRKVSDLNSDIRVGPFYQDTQNVISPYILSGSKIVAPYYYLLYQSQNVGNSSAFGGEIEIKGKNASGFRWDANYSFSHVTDSPTVLSAVDFQGSSPQHQVYLSAGYTTGAWEFDGHGRYASSTDMIRSPNGGITTPMMSGSDYVSVGGRIGYNITENLTAALSGSNLSSSVSSQSPFPSVERQAFLSLTARY